MLKYISNITAHVELLSASILSASDNNMDVKTDTSKLLVDKSSAKTGSSGKESCYHTDSPLYEDISDDESFLELLDSSEQKNVSGNISGKQCERKTVACSGKKFEGGGGDGSDFGHSGFSAVRSVAKLENIVEKATPTPVKKSTENMSVQNCLPVKIEKPRTLKFPSATPVVSKNTPCDKDRSVPCDKVQAKRSTDEGGMPQVDRLLEPHKSTDTTCSDAHSTSCNHNDSVFNSLKQLEEKCSVSHGKFNVASVDSDSRDGADGDVKGVAVHSKHCVDSEVLPNICEKLLQNVPSTLRIPRESDGGQELNVATSLSATSDCKTQDKSKRDIASTVSDSLSMVDEQKLKLSDSTATPDSERPISDVDQKLLDKDLSGACGNKSPASVTRPAHIDDALRTAVNRDSFSCDPAETDCTPSLSEVQTRKRLSVLEDVSLEQKCRRMSSETVLNSDSVEKEVTSSELEEDRDICVLYVSKEKFQKVKSSESCLLGTNVSKDVSLKSLTVARGTSEVKVSDSCYQAIKGSEVEIRDEINNSFNKKLKLSSLQGSACMENDSITNIIENKSNLDQEQLKSPAINTHILKAQGHTSLASTEVGTITKMPSVENGVVNRQILESSVDDVVHSVNTAVLDNPCARTEEEVKPSSLTSVESVITSIVTLSKESVGVTSSGVENTNFEHEMALLDKNVNLAAVASPEPKEFSVVACEKIGFSVSVLDREHEKGEARKAVEIISGKKSNVRIDDVVHSVNTAVLDNPCARTEEEVKPSSLTSVESVITSIVTLSKESVGVTSSGVENTNFEHEMALLDKNVNLAAVASPEPKEFSVVACEKIGFSVSVLDREHEKGEARKALEIISEEKSNVRITANCEETRNEEPLILGMKSTAETTTEDAEEIKESLSPTEIVADPKTPSVQQVPDVRVKDSAKEMKISSPVYYSRVTGAATDLIPAKEMDSVTILQSSEEKILGTLKTADLTALATKPSSEETEAVPSSADSYQALKSQSVEELLVAAPAKDCVEPAGETEATMHPSIENTLEATVLQLPENTIEPPVVEKTLEVVMPMKEVLKQPFTENTVDEVMSSLVQNSREVVVLPFAENAVEMLVSSAEKPLKVIVPSNAENTIEVTSTNNILETVSSPVGGISEEIIVPSGEEVLITSVQTIEAVMVPSAVETKEAKVLQSGVDFKEALMLSTALETKQAMVLSPTVESKEINATQPSKDSEEEIILLSSEKSAETMNELGLSFTKMSPELVVPPCSKEQPVGKPKPPPSEKIAIVLSGEETSDELIISDEFSAKVSSTSVGETFSKIVPISSEETYSKFETERALTPVATIDSVTELEPKILTPPTIGAENETGTASLSAVESLTATEDFATAPVTSAEKGTKTELVSGMDKKTAMLTVPAKKGTAIASLLAVEKETTVTSVSSVENSTIGSIHAVEKDNATLLVPGVKKDMVMPVLDAEKETTTVSLSALKNKTVTDHFAPVAATEKDTAIEHVPEVEKETRTAPVFDVEMETSAARESAVEKKTAAEQHMAGVEKEFMTLTLPVDKKESATVTVPIKGNDSATITVPVVEMETVTVTVPVVEEKTPTVTIPDVEEESATVNFANVEKYSETAPVLSVVMETTPACESAVEKKNAAGLLAGNEKKSDTVTAPVVIKESATVTVPIVEKESATVTVPVVEEESMTVTGPVLEKESVTVAALDNISKTAPVHSVDIETVPTCESTMEKKTAKGPLAGIEKCVTVTAPVVEKESSPVTDAVVRKESATVTIAVVEKLSEIAPVLSVDMDLVPECESAVVEKIAEGHIVGMEKESGTVALPVVEKNSEISPVLSDDVEMAPACVPAVEKKTAAGPMAGMEKVTDTVTVPVVEKDLDPEGNVGKEVVSGVEKKIVSLTEKETGIVPVSTVEKEMALPLTPVVKYKTANSIGPNVEKDSINTTVMQSEVIPALTSSFAEKVTANEINLGTKSAEEDSCDSKSPEGLTKGISVPQVLKHLDVSLQMDDHTTENVMAMFAGNTGNKTSATCVDEIAETHGLEKPLVTLSRDNLSTVDEVSEESTSLGETPVLSTKPVITVLFPDDEPCEIASSPTFELVDAESLPGMDHVEASKKAAFASKANETEVSSSCVDSSEETCFVGAAGNVSAASCTLKEGLRQVPVGEICVSNSDQGCVSDTDQVTVSNVEQNLQSVEKINSDQFQNSVDLNKEVRGIMKKRKLSDTDLESDDSTQPRNKSATSAKCDTLIETSLSHDSSVSPSLTFVNDKQSMETTDVLLSDKTKLFPETVNGRVSSCKTNSSSLTENIPTVTKLKMMQKKDKSKCLASQISLAQMLSDSGCSDNSDSSSSNLVPDVSDRTASESSDINSSSLALKRRLSNLDQGESKKVRVGRDKEQKISKESRHRANGSFPVTEEQSLLRDANMKASFSNKDLCSLPSKKPTTKIDFSIERVATKGAAEASDLLPEEKRELLSYVGQFDIENLQNLNARSFDKYVLLKTCQGFLHHSEFGVLRKECDKCCACCEDFEKKNLSLQKQVKDLLTVVQRLKTELLTKNPRTVTPIKIIRSVGLQVQIQSQPAQSHSTEVRQQSKFISKKRMREMESKGLRKKSIRILNSPRSSSFLTPASTGTLPQKPTPQPSPVKGVPVEKPLPSGFARKPQSADGSAPTPLGQRTQAHPQIRNQSVPNNARIMQSPAKPAEKQTTVQAPVSTPPQAQAPRGGSLLSKIVPSTPRTGSVIDLTDDEDKKASQSADQVSAPQVPTPVIRLVQPHQLTGPSPKNATAPQGVYTRFATEVNAQNAPALLIIHATPQEVRPSAMSVQTRHSVPHSTAAAKNSAVGSTQQSGAGLAAASAVAAAAAAAGVGSSGVAHQPGGTVVTPPTQQTPQIRVANLKSMKPLYMDHPAPLPPTPIHQSISASRKLPPPKPNLKLSKVTNKDQQGIVLSWNMSLSAEHEQVASYQLYAYQEGKERPSTDLWKKVGDVKALPLPMACTLTQFMDGHKYYFAVRAVDIFTRTGQFSDPSGIVLNRK